jgi:hypothetical protein
MVLSGWVFEFREKYGLLRGWAAAPMEQEPVLKGYFL